MTNYSTETEAESYEAADLARIALQAAIDAVDAYQARNGVCDAPFRCTLHVDNGNEADREGIFPPITTEDEAREIGRASLRQTLDRSVPDGVQTHDDGWIRHDGGECPVHPMDVVEIINDLGGRGVGALPAEKFLWLGVDYYRPLRDSDGVPYCSAEGLEDWAEYVATDKSGGPSQCENKPYTGRICWRAIGSHSTAPSCFSNTREYWSQTLRRVYRKDDA